MTRFFINSFKLLDPDKCVVISIEEARSMRAEKRAREECDHSQVIIDAEYQHLTCKACDIKLNPVEWIKRMAQEWHHYQRCAEEYKTALAELDKRSHLFCKQCGTKNTIKTKRSW